MVMAKTVFMPPIELNIYLYFSKVVGLIALDKEIASSQQNSIIMDIHRGNYPM